MKLSTSTRLPVDRDGKTGNWAVIASSLNDETSRRLFRAVAQVIYAQLMDSAPGSTLTMNDFSAGIAS